MKSARKGESERQREREGEVFFWGGERGVGILGERRKGGKQKPKPKNSSADVEKKRSALNGREKGIGVISVPGSCKKEENQEKMGEKSQPRTFKGKQ